MPAQRGVHPSPDVLKAFGLGKLDERSSGSVIEHLDQCDDCRQKVAALSGDDFLDRLRQAHSRSSTPAPAKSLVDAPRAAKLPPELAANEQYEILRELGRGGMGVVYLAKNKLMDRLEVLKVINKGLLDRQAMPCCCRSSCRSVVGKSWAKGNPGAWANWRRIDSTWRTSEGQLECGIVGLHA